MIFIDTDRAVRIGEYLNQLTKQDLRVWGEIIPGRHQPLPKREKTDEQDPSKTASRN